MHTYHFQQLQVHCANIVSLPKLYSSQNCLDGVQQKHFSIDQIHSYEVYQFPWSSTTKYSLPAGPNKQPQIQFKIYKVTQEWIIDNLTNTKQVEAITVKRQHETTSKIIVSSTCGTIQKLKCHTSSSLIQ
jgi:hypothetical protein